MRTLIFVLATAGLVPTAGLAPDPAADPPPGIREFRIADAWGRDTVEFRTVAPVEEIVGTTNRVTGFLRADPRNLRGPGTAARVELPVSSLRTGVSMRDGAVAKALGAPGHPVAVFTLDSVGSVSAAGLEPNRAVDLQGEGTLEMNGLRRQIPVEARLTYVSQGGPLSQLRPGNFVKLVARFDVRLDDFGVARRGAVLPLQVGEIAHVTVSALADDASPEEREKYRQSARDYLREPVN
jgi:polyisoprenoid-binding protein YceI